MKPISVPRQVFLLAAFVAAMLACARVAASANPCGSCPSGQCCDVTGLEPTCVTASGPPTNCLAPDGLCQATGVPNCHCCDSSNTCVDSCPNGQCCEVTAGRTCVTASGPPTNCLAPDGVCQAPGVPNCFCCDRSNTCVASCGIGACVSGTCEFATTTDAPIMSHRVAIGLILTVTALGLLRLWRNQRRAR